MEWIKERSGQVRCFMSHLSASENRTPEADRVVARAANARMEMGQNYYGFCCRAAQDTERV